MIDELGRNNHETVARINESLKERGLVTWFDADRLEGDVSHGICKGVDLSAVVIVFVTKNYLEKVEQDVKDDYCKLEFNYSVKRKSSRFMIAVPMEPRVQETNTWFGPVGFLLSSRLYRAQFFTGVESDFEKNVDALCYEVFRLCQSSK
eukprot:Pompholyxophrys_punicea_v1_NODE_1067_length_991_cov_3.924145.p1 type:complete len:149 gc:universal NODE_1067_length_991_cov_3.924145:387-833(+)